MKLYINFGEMQVEASICASLMSQGRSKKITRDPDLFLVAKLDGEIPGTVLGGFDGRRGLMVHLAVAPEHRRQGIANRLVDAFEDRLGTKGCICYYLLVTNLKISGSGDFSRSLRLKPLLQKKFRPLL